MKAKILVTIEVGIVFILMVYLFRSVNALPSAMKITNFFDSLLFPGYAAVLVVSLSLYLFKVRTQPKSPFPQKLRYQLDIAAYGFFPFFILSVLLTWIDWRQWTGAILVSIIEIGLFLWFAWIVREKPAGQKLGEVIGSFVLFPIAFQIWLRLGSIIVAIVYYYLFVALSEEILFRGYIQTRLNSIFGRPRRFLGVGWGWGLMITSVLFGLWHLGWKPDMPGWPHVLWTIFAGLFLGFVREKSEGVIASTLLHGIMNYGPQAILFFLFWSN